jgi:hypothetical protein
MRERISNLSIRIHMTMQAMMNMPMSMPNSMGGMPMQAMMPTMKLSAGKADCEFKPAKGMDKAAFQGSCQMLEMMVQAGMPLVFQSGNMSMMCVSDSPAMTMPMMMPMMSMMPSMLCSVKFDMRADMMACQMVPGKGMNTDVFDACCKLMEKMMQLGMPMMVTCNGSPVMYCTV